MDKIHLQTKPLFVGLTSLKTIFSSASILPNNYTLLERKTPTDYVKGKEKGTKQIENKAHRNVYGSVETGKKVSDLLFTCEE
ncbi:Hypothetical predicted protein [Octopus vulgaris]|uniref:Uncharacterized protein n=1 Tax=Octopus vulgaris TaxID=6645 RepID=A0AA36F763_OCTVU|nr:Hypothetical predicted protein [Octopus vulgaris]